VRATPQAAPKSDEELLMSFLHQALPKVRQREPVRWTATAMLCVLTLSTLSGCLNETDAEAAHPFSGYAEADLVYLAPSAGGVLQQLPVHRGDHVAPGAPLFQLDTAYEDFGRDAAVAQHSRAQAQLADLSKGRRKEEIRAIKAQLAQARAAYTVSDAQLKRQQELVKQGYVSAAQMDELDAARTRDKARIKELDAQLALARGAARPDAISAAKADVKAAGAQVSQQEWATSQKSRTAPVGATVFDVLYRQGEWVAAGQPVVVLLPDRGVKVRFFVPQSQLTHAKVGGLVQVFCDQCAPGQARVRYVSPQAEFTPPVIYSNESRGKLVYLIEATPEGPLQQALKPGQPLTVRWSS
jgi:HlyD family secretion protein